MSDQPKEEKKERELKTKGRNLPALMPSPRALQPADQKQSAVATFFSSVDLLTHLPPFLDIFSLLNLRKTSKPLQTALDEETLARRLLQENIGPDLTRLIKPDEKAQDAYIRHQEFLRSEFLLNNMIEMIAEIINRELETHGRTINWLGALEELFVDFGKYYPEVVITVLLRHYKINHLEAVIRHFPQYKVNIIKRVIADKQAYIHQCKNLDRLQKFLFRFPLYLEPMTTNLLDVSIFIQLFKNIEDLKFFYSLPIQLATHILRQVMTNKLVFQHLFKHRDDLLSFLKAFPSEAKKVIEQILADEELFNHLFKRKEHLSSLLFLPYIHTAEKILARQQQKLIDSSPSAVAVSGLGVTDKKSEAKLRPELETEDQPTTVFSLHRNPLNEAEELAYVGLPAIGPDVSKLIKPGQSVCEAYEYHRDLIQHDFYLYLSDDPYRVELEPELVFAGKIEAYKSQYHPSVIFQALINQVRVNQFVKIIHQFPQYESQLLEHLFSKAENFNRMVTDLTDLWALNINYSVGISAAERNARRERRLALIMHHLLTHENSFMHLIIDSETFSGFLSQYNTYSDVISHHVVTKKNIFRHIFKKLSDLSKVLTNQARLCKEDFFSKNNPWYSKHFKSMLIAEILADEVVFGRLFSNSAKLGSFVSKFGRGIIRFTEAPCYEQVDQVLQHIITHPAIFDRLFHNHHDLQAFLDKFQGIGFTHDPQVIIKHIFAHTDLFKRFFEKESDILCLHIYCSEREYYTEARAILLSLQPTEQPSPSLLPTGSYTPTLFPSAAANPRPTEAKREFKTRLSQVDLSHATPLDEGESTSSQSSAALSYGPVDGR